MTANTINLADYEPVTEGYEQAPVEPTLKEKALSMLNPAATPEMMMNMGSGMIAKPLGDIAGLGTIGLDLITGAKGNYDPEAVKRGVQESLTYTPRTLGGKLFSEYNPLALFGQGVSNVGEYVGNTIRDSKGGVRDMLADAAEEAVVQAPGLIGALRARSTGIANKEGALAKIRNVNRDAALAAGRSEGFKVNPSDVNKGSVNKAATSGIEWVGGRPELQSLLSEHNVEKVNNLYRESIGLPENTSLSHEVLKNVRDKAGAAFDKARGAGHIDTDVHYFDALDNIQRDWANQKSSFPLSVNPATKIIRSITEDGKGNQLASLDADHVVTKINELRKKADAAYKDPKTKELGHVYKASANALEDLLERGITNKANAANPPSMQNIHFFDETVADIRKARAQIAKTYLGDATLEGSDISAVKLAAKNRAGKVLDPKLKIAANMGEYFKPALTKTTVKSSAPFGSIADIRTAGTTGILGAAALSATNPVLGALMGVGTSLIRPAIRHIEASNWGQKHLATPKYKRGYIAPAGIATVGGLAASDERKKEDFSEPMEITINGGGLNQVK